MSTTPNETLVDSLADLLLSWTGDSREAARAFVEEHQLVSLPEDPRWEVEWDDEFPDPWDLEPSRKQAEVCAIDPSLQSTGRIRPVYVIPGEPIDVQEGE